MSRQSLNSDEDRAAGRHRALGYNCAVHFEGDVQRAFRYGFDVRGFDLDLHLSDRQLVGGADLGSFDDEEVVLIAEDPVLHEERETPELAPLLDRHNTGHCPR